MTDVAVRSGEMVPAPAVAADLAYRDQIVRWSDVRPGDLVLYDDCLIVAEQVNIVPKPWGDGTDFIAVDITWHDDEGHQFCSERHGDRLTAVRRPAPH